MRIPVSTRGAHRLIATVAVVLSGVFFRDSSPASAVISRPFISPCSWVARADLGEITPFVAAQHIVQAMSLRQLASFIQLRQVGTVENTNGGIPALCLPPLTLVDGPSGVGAGARGVTQFPSEISLAATFDPLLARSMGYAMGQEALAKGYDVLQAPDLNLVRTANSGRAFETYGEDPWLASVLGVQTVMGIQSTGVIAQAKHYTVYTQENARARVNQVVSSRVMQEVYDAPFRAVVSLAHVGSIMCAMGSINGVNTCSYRALYQQLRAWGFRGFVRSDYAAVTEVAPALAAGISLLKPVTTSQIESAVMTGQVGASALRHAVAVVIAVMLKYGLMRHERNVAQNVVASTPSHLALALQVATESITLLKNDENVLPLVDRGRKIAIIGIDAQHVLTTRGLGSSGVHASWVISPLIALRHALRRDQLNYVSGGPATLEVDTLQSANLVTGTLPKKSSASVHVDEPGKSDLSIDYASIVTSAALTATSPSVGEGWSSWTFTFRARRTGAYVVGTQDTGDTWLRLNGQLLLADTGLHGLSPWSTSVELTKGQNYTITAQWFAINAKTSPRFGLSYVQPAINAAVNSARKASTAVIFVANNLSEGADQPTLFLPGDANALISAVAAVNPHTVVVLNTGGPVLMPWQSHVAAIVEAWYPGQMDGAAVAAVLSGRVSPSGRLPVTFPTSAAMSPASTISGYPGVKGTVNIGGLSGLGYRWYQSNAVTPDFAFGYGLSYTRFQWSNLGVETKHGTVEVALNVRNTGQRQGTDVVEVYVHFPTSYNEPLEQLRGVSRVSLAPRQSRTITIMLAPSSFDVAAGLNMVAAHGQFRIDVGRSANDLVGSALVTL